MPKPYTAASAAKGGPLLKSEPQKGQSTITYEMKKNQQTDHHLHRHPCPIENVILELSQNSYYAKKSQN